MRFYALEEHQIMMSTLHVVKGSVIQTGYETVQRARKFYH